MSLNMTETATIELTKETEKIFKLAYNLSDILESDYKPIVKFPSKSVEILRKFTELRKKDWRDSSRWNSAADFTGLVGELAAQRYYGVSADEAFKHFSESLKDGNYYDVDLHGLKLDVKSTKGQALRFKFSKKINHSIVADGFIFSYVELVGPEAHIYILGWCLREEVSPYLRDDGRSYYARFETLRRDNILKQNPNKKAPLN